MVLNTAESYSSLKETTQVSERRKGNQEKGSGDLMEMVEIEESYQDRLSPK